FHLHHPSHGRRGMAARRAEHLAWHGQHVHPDRLVGDDGDGVGVAQAARLREAPAVPDHHVRPRRRVPREPIVRIRGSPPPRRGAGAQHVPGDLFHAHRPARVAHHRRHDRDAVLARAGREDVADEPGAVHRPDRVHRALLALCRPGVDLPVPGVVFAVGAGVGAHMDSDTGSVKKSIRGYMMVGAALFVFTAITVAVNQVHLAIPLAITVALIIASIKGSMVASVFMHLSNEKKWIYGALLLTLAFFIVLMSVPMFTVGDSIGTPIGAANASHAQPPER